MKKLFMILILIFNSANAQQWELLYSVDYLEENATEIYQVAVNSKSEIFMIAYDNEQPIGSWLYKSTNKGTTWTNINKDTTIDIFNAMFNFYYYPKFKIDSKDYLYVSVDSILMRSKDNGNTFEIVLDGKILEDLIQYRDEKYNTETIYFDFAPNDDIFVYIYWPVEEHGNQWIIKSTDRGETWEIVDNTYVRFYKLAFDKDWNVYTSWDFTAYMSDDTCKGWKRFDTYDNLEFENVGWPISLDIDNRDNIFILDEVNNVIKTSDKGLTWELSFKGYPGPAGYNIETSKNGWIFSPKAYSEDNGNSWKPNPTYFRFFYPSDSSCLAISSRFEIWRFTYEPIGVEEESYIGSTFLSPNPATDYIEIKTNNVETGLRPVLENIEIFDVLGKNPSLTLPDIREGTIRLDVSHLHPGIYFVKTGNQFLKFIKL